MNCGVFYVVEKMERETRIELATNSLEGCDSTIELLPHSVLILLPPRLSGVPWQEVSRGYAGKGSTSTATFKVCS